MDFPFSPSASQEWKRTKTDPVFFAIVIFVIFIHFGLLWFLPNIKSDRIVKNRTQVHVTTIQLTPKKNEIELTPLTLLKKEGSLPQKIETLLPPLEETIPLSLLETPPVEPPKAIEKLIAEPIKVQPEKENIQKKIEEEPKSVPKKKVEEPQKSPQVSKPKPMTEKKNQVPQKPKTPAPVKNPIALPDPQKEALKRKKEEEQANLDQEKKRLLEVQLQKEKEIKLQKEKELSTKRKITKQKIASVKQSGQSLLASIPMESDVAIPKGVTGLQVEGIPVTASGLLNSTEASYQGKIKFRLEQNLRLPERGEVEIKLTLNKSGKIVKFETTSPQSLKNRQYIEQKIPSIVFPEFDASLNGETQHLFTIQLKAQ